MASFTPKVTKARLVLSPFTSEQMLNIGNELVKSIGGRIKKGLNANDQTARPLTQAYGRRKQRKGLAPVRDWMYSGRTLRSMKVLSANENAGKIGFTDDRTNKVVAILNQKDKMFGLSPTDKEAANKAVGDVLRTGNVIQVKAA